MLKHHLSLSILNFGLEIGNSRPRRLPIAQLTVSKHITPSNDTFINLFVINRLT